MGYKTKGKIVQGQAITVNLWPTTQNEDFPHCIGVKLLFQTSKGITIKINNLNILITINNDCVNKKTHLIRQSFKNRTYFKITARQYTMKLLHFVFWVTVSSHTCWQKYVPVMTLNIHNTKQDSFGKNKASSAGKRTTNECSQSGTENKTTYFSLLETNYCVWFVGGLVVICQPLSLFYLLYNVFRTE